MPQATITYGNVSGIRGMCYTMSRGVLPSIFTLYVIPQDNFDPGVQTLTFGMDNNTISLSDCVVDSAFLRPHWDQKWPMWAVTGYDRRWKWRFASVGGDFNRRQANGTVDPSTQANPASLIQYIGQAMGENIDTSRVPSGVWPRVQWTNQRADLALQALCDYLACEVVLNPVSGTVEIWPLGSGASLPTGTTETTSKYSFVPRAKIPSTIEAHGGDSVFQSRLKLQAVVDDNSSGQSMPVASSTYSSSWSTESPWSFPSITDATKRATAFDEIHREFRVIGQQDGSIKVPNCPVQVGYIDQYLLNDRRLDSEKDLEGYYRSLPFYCDGDYYAYTDIPANTSGKIYTGNAILDPARRIVKFPYPLVKLTSSGAYDYAQLYLTTSYRVQDQYRNVVHLYRSGNVGGSGGTLVLRRPEVFASYSATSGSTEAQASSELDIYCSLFIRKYVNPVAAELTYGGFVSGTLDGRIAQARWEIHPTKGATTQVSENFEADIYSVGAAERARRLGLERLVEKYS